MEQREGWIFGLKRRKDVEEFVRLNSQNHTKMLEVLKECVQAYVDHKRGIATSELWPDPNHIFHAKQLIKEIDSEWQPN